MSDKTQGRMHEKGEESEPKVKLEEQYREFEQLMEKEEHVTLRKEALLAPHENMGSFDAGDNDEYQKDTFTEQWKQRISRLKGLFPASSQEEESRAVDHVSDNPDLDEELERDIDLDQVLGWRFLPIHRHKPK